MINCRVNFKNKYKNDLICGKCHKEDENLAHLVTCYTNSSIDVNEIYGNDVDKIYSVTEIVNIALAKKERE